MTAPAWHEEAITRQHDRGTFDCGDEELNTFLKRYATTPGKKIRFTHQQKEAIRQSGGAKAARKRRGKSPGTTTSTAARFPGSLTETTREGGAPGNGIMSGIDT